jgi:hypothetical protein
MSPRHVQLVVVSFAALAAVSSAAGGCGSADAAKPLPDLSDVPALDCGLSVSRAYALIPHRRTEFDTALTSMPRRDKAYLNLVFHVIDQSIVLRVAALRDFSKGQADGARLIAAMRRETDFLRGIEPPARLKSYHESLIRAISDQTTFFEEWCEMGPRFRHANPQTFSNHPKVQSASQALRRAHGLLLEAYPSEAERTKDAFFDYHCARDFV